MKIIQIIAIFALLLALNAILQRESNDGTQSVQPRKNQSCDSQTVFGWYWDGQKCERCLDVNCFCENKVDEKDFTEKCTKCRKGYIYVDSQDYNGKAVKGCVQCPLGVYNMGEAFTEYVTDSTSNVLFHSQTTCTTGCDSAFINTDKLNVKVSQTRAQTLPDMSVADNENVYTESTFPFSLGSLPNMALAFRATGGCEKDNLISLRAAPLITEKVSDATYNNNAYSNWISLNNFNDYTQQQKILAFSNFCYKIQGCLEYNDTLRCKTCFPGYYLNEKELCSPCSQQCVKDGIFAEGVNLPSDPYATSCDLNYKRESVCDQCSGPKQCQTCKIGYFLYQWDEQSGYASTAFTTQMEYYQINSGVCLRCPSGCSCKFNSGYNNGDNKSAYINTSDAIKRINEYFSIDRKKAPLECPKCAIHPDINDAFCLTCEEVGTTTLKWNCKTCDRYYVLTSAFKCQKCPDNCFACSLSPTTQTSTCNVDSCYNGYYQFATMQSNEQIITCKKCSDLVDTNSENFKFAARCYVKIPVNTDTKEVPTITQCQTKTQSLIQFQKDVIGVHNYAIGDPKSPSYFKDDYYLVTLTGSVPKCVINQYLCRKMKDYTGLCDSCYSGYVMIDSKCYPCNAVNAGEATGKYSDTDGDAYSRNYCLDCEKRADATDFAAKKYLQCKSCQQIVLSSIETHDDTQYSYYLRSKVEATKELYKVCWKCTDSSNGYGCLKCEDNQNLVVCSSCKPGYRMEPAVAVAGTSVKCNKCLNPNCYTCIASIQQCTVCFPGYRLWQSLDNIENVACERCEEGCKTCSKSRKICDECFVNKGYYLWDTQCFPIRKNCAQMVEQTSGSATYACKTCNYGYRLVDGKCLLCFSPDIGYYHCPNDTKAHTSYQSNIVVATPAKL